MAITKAKRRAEYPAENQPKAIAAAITHLKVARDLLRKAGAKNAADYVARAMKSAEGALRHAKGCGLKAYQVIEAEERMRARP